MVDTTYYKQPNETLDQYNARIASYNASKTGQPPTTSPVASPVPSTGNGLLDFKNAFDYAANLAKQKRNQLSLSFMQPLQGTVAASDFSSILGNLNQASDTFASDIMKNAAETSFPKPIEVSPGASLYDPSSRTSVYTAPTAAQQNSGNPPKPGKPIGNGAPSNFTADDKTALEEALRTGQASDQRIGNPMGSDGYIDPSVYIALMNYWIQQGGTKESFFSNFPHKKYINPANTWVWDQLGIENPNSDDEDLYD